MASLEQLTLKQITAERKGISIWMVNNDDSESNFNLHSKSGKHT